MGVTSDWSEPAKARYRPSKNLTWKALVCERGGPFFAIWLCLRTSHRLFGLPPEAVPVRELDSGRSGQPVG